MSIKDPSAGDYTVVDCTPVGSPRASTVEVISVVPLCAVTPFEDDEAVFGDDDAEVVDDPDVPAALPTFDDRDTSPLGFTIVGPLLEPRWPAKRS